MQLLLLLKNLSLLLFHGGKIHETTIKHTILKKCHTMENSTKTYNKIAALFIFVGLPFIIWFLSAHSQRSLLKNVLSLITILAFFMMLFQFYISRLNKKVLQAHKIRTVIHWHKIIGYIFVSILLIHPFLLVVPRYFEAGIVPKDAFIEIINTLETRGIVLGIIAWILMLLLGLTAMFRSSLRINYKLWRKLHGYISLVFIIIATIHVLLLGRHINMPMGVFIILLSSGAIVMLCKTYFFKPYKNQ